MFENENPVIEEVTENVEGQTTEENPGQVEQKADERAEKLYTKEELDRIVEKKITRREAKIHKDYQKKYGPLENVLKAGLGKDNVEEMTGALKGFYEEKGIQIPNEPTYSSKDLEVLAKAEAEEIIESGLEEVIEEVERLANIGLKNMNEREKKIFKRLADYRKTAEQSRELSKIGVTEDVYTSKEFQEFASKFNSDTSIVDVYNIYKQMKPKKEIRQPGSMKSTAVEDNGVKDFYSYEEAMKFTKADFDKNPELFKAVERSMTKWK